MEKNIDYIFRIDNKLEHMVTPVEGEHPRIAIGGWFYPTKLIAIK